MYVDPSQNNLSVDDVIGHGTMVAEIAAGVPVVPVALDSGRLWPRRGVARPGIVTFRFGAPIPPDMPRAEVEALVHRAMNELDTPRVG